MKEIDIEKFRESLTHPKLPKMTLQQIASTEAAVIKFVEEK